jgi:two-component system C4-dicarboxylate transport sensor histidine kinase DctB
MENTLASTGLLVEQGELQRASSKVQAARDLLRRIQRTIKILRSFAKNEPVAREPIDINKSLATAIELAQHRAAGASITLEPSAEQPVVVGNATRFEQAVLNLLINALDAVQGRSDPTVVVRCSIRNGRAEISVRDNGPGIAREIEDRILEPFFTTKTTGEGLGLGLSIAREIVEDYGGRLSLATTGDCGCMFVIDMPLDAPNERSNSDEPRVNPVR